MSFDKIVPNSINLELRNAYNLICITCPRSYSDFEVGHMKVENAKRIIDDLKNNVKIICLSVFGEIFAYPHLQEVVSYIKTINHKICTYLNKISLRDKHQKMGEVL